MANVKISALPAASALSGTEVFPIVQSGVTSKATVSTLAAFAGSVAGSDSQIQYNNSGAFGGDSRLTFDDTNKVAKGQFTVDSGGVNAQTGTTYTLAATDNGAVVTLNNASSITVTVPSGLGKGFSCICIQIGAGQVTFSAGSGATLNAANGLKTANQHSAVSLISYVANTFNVAGDTAT